MHVRITHIDGKLPNLALMAIAHIHRRRGDEIYFSRDVERGLFEPNYGHVYGSCLFLFSLRRLTRFRLSFPDAIIGGTGVGSSTATQIGTNQLSLTVENTVGEPDGLDYSIYPDFAASIGFTQRGCRLSCKFCVVPTKEGKNRAVKSIAEIWRGPGYARKLHLLDNDFFGQPREQWRARIQEIRDGGFRVCLNQGINVRLLDDEAAEALGSIEYRDDQFQRRTLYTAWDNFRDEEIFFAGIDRLERAGIPAHHVMAYMLIGFDSTETWDRIWHRFQRMVEREIRPYPMVYDRSRSDLLCFQRWVITGLYRIVPWNEYRRSTKSEESLKAYREMTESAAEHSPVTGSASAV
jgi:hypothetical protein